MLAAVVIGASLAVMAASLLAWKWELGVARSALVVVALTIAIAAALAAFGVPPVLAGSLVFFGGLGLAGLIVLWRFYRDPEREAPERDDVVVSPADGTVIYVKQSAEGVLPASVKGGREFALEELVRTRLSTDDAIVVGIALSFLDVHVNRAALEGKVTVQRRFAGQFMSLKREDAVVRNERSTTVIRNDSLEVGIVLIASRLVRRILSYVQEGEQVALGQRIGVIRFGSQVDLVMPLRPDLRLLVAPGDRVRAGDSVVAIIERTADGSSDPPGEVVDR
jgi:phosphatidylserine decarboxylase